MAWMCRLDVKTKNDTFLFLIRREEEAEIGELGGCLEGRKGEKESEFK